MAPMHRRPWLRLRHLDLPNFPEPWRGHSRRHHLDHAEVGVVDRAVGDHLDRVVHDDDLAAVEVGDPGVPTSPNTAGLAMTSASSESRSSSGALALGFGRAVKEGDSVKAMTGGVSMLARQMLHSCSSLMTSLTSRRANAPRKPPECMKWRPAERQRAMSSKS